MVFLKEILFLNLYRHVIHQNRDSEDLELRMASVGTMCKKELINGFIPNLLKKRFINLKSKSKKFLSSLMVALYVS